MVVRRDLISTLLFVVLASLSLSGCDQLREQLASVISPKSADETLQSVRNKLEAGKFKEAKADAEPLAVKPGARQAEFALAAAQACGNLGEISQALEFLSIALKAGAVNAEALMSDPSFESIRSDIRFVSLMTNPSSMGSAASSTHPAAALTEPAKPATAIRMDSQGIEVKAGSISIKLPD